VEEKDEKREAESAAKRVAGWLEEIEMAEKREKRFRKAGNRIVQIYEGEETEKIPFNILYSNTETIQPALYNKTPVPRVNRRFKDGDKVGKWVAEISRRTLAFYLASTNPSKDSIDTVFESAILDSLVPGRGLVRFAFDATFTDGEPAELLAEGIRNEVVPWNRFCFGYADCWEDVPWFAFEHSMQEDEVEKNFSSDIAKEIGYSTLEDESVSGTGEGRKGKELDGGLPERFACIYEVWDKVKREVIFVSPGFKERELKVVEDPLQLAGFFPFARPLSMKMKLDSLLPTPLYLMYEQQAHELNDITIRIRKITAALRVRGFYDSTIEGLDRLLESGDNTLFPANNVAAMQQGATLDKSIWFMPLQELVGVLQQLYLNRTQTKSTIYEITGIADIMRGSSQASETLGAQQIKTQWGSLRLQRMQKLVNRFIRDNLQILAEIALTKLSRDSIQEITNIKLMTLEEKQQLQMQMQLQAQQAQAMGGQPPPPPPPQVMQMLARPTWEEVEEVYKNDLLRGYTISQETDATIDAETMEEKRQASEFMNAMAQFLNGTGQAMAAGLLPFPAAKAMLLSLVRKFQFGMEVEEEIEGMQQPAPPKPEGKGDGEEAGKAASMLAMEQAKADAQVLQLEVQLKEMEFQGKSKALQQKAAIDDANFQLKMAQLNKRMRESVAEGQAAMAEHATSQIVDMVNGGNGDATV